MLKELECGAPGARGAAPAVDCRDRPAFPVKKLVQARLPFKRLTLVPKEKAEDASDDLGDSQGAPVDRKVPDLEASLDNLETNCPTDADLDFAPKLINGKGPLDNFFISNGTKTTIAQNIVIIDLTEDSNDQPDSTADHSTLNPEAPALGGAVNGTGAMRGPQGHLQAGCGEERALPEEALSDAPRQAGPGAAWRTGSPEGSSPRAPGARAREEPRGWSAAGGILFREKVPVVVLQDILAARAPQARSPPTPPRRSPTPDTPDTPGSEARESSPEGDSVLSSPLSSSSHASSPEGPPTPPARPADAAPSPASTPAHRISKKLVKESAEKNRMRLQREEKEKLREEARQAREQARRRREEEKELKEKERREKREKDEKERAEKQRLKAERRKERQEALEAKLEEKRKKEEEKRLREEEKRIKAEKAEITRFFQKPKTPQAPKTLAGSCGKFAPFEIKEHMVLAPRCRAAFGQDVCDRLDRLLQQQGADCSFLRDLKARRPLRSGPTRVCSRSADLFNSKVDGVPERRTFGRMKLLQFSENHRPAYWGTWNKKTTVIRPRDPWAQDKELLDYEVDSDEEWEEEEPGESLSHSEGDDDDDVGEDEDEDDGFFVPHGYLSEDEGVTEECVDPEKHKVRQKLKAEEWDSLVARGRRLRVLQPVQIGCVWAAGVRPGPEPDAELKLLQQFAACPLEEEEEPPKACGREKRDQQILAQLLPLLHGNVNGSKVIIREFQEHCRRGLLSQDAAVPSKAKLKRIISENSVYEKRPEFRMCWYVHPQVLKSFDREHLPVPCQWSYVTMIPAAPRELSAPAPAPAPAPGPSQGTPVALKRKSAGSMCITQFMKKRRHEGQVGVGDMDGFQADTEEEEEEEDSDCMIMDIPGLGEAQDPGASAGAAGAMGLDAGESRLPASPLGAW